VILIPFNLILLSYFNKLLAFPLPSLLLTKLFATYMQRNHQRKRRRNDPSTSSRDSNIVYRALSHNSVSANSTVRVINEIGQLASTSGGVINNVISLSPSGFSDWSSLAPLYDEWRLLGCKVIIYSALPLNSASLPASAVVVFDNDDATTGLSNQNQALDYRVQRQFNTVWTSGVPYTLVAKKMSAADRSTGPLWNTTATPTASPCSFKFYSSGLSVSTTYLNVIFQLVLEFRSSI
jgi:hypothetical protein